MQDDQDWGFACFSNLEIEEALDDIDGTCAHPSEIASASIDVLVQQFERVKKAAAILKAAVEEGRMTGRLRELPTDATGDLLRARALTGQAWKLLDDAILSKRKLAAEQLARERGSRLNPENESKFNRGAAVAFGLLGMAEAIRLSTDESRPRRKRKAA